MSQPEEEGMRDAISKPSSKKEAELMSLILCGLSVARRWALRGGGLFCCWGSTDGLGRNQVEWAGLAGSSGVSELTDSMPTMVVCRVRRREVRV